jgi:toxin ParE1/3/4
VKLRFTPKGASELEAILDYIADRSSQGAVQVQERLQAVTALLLLHPHAGRLTSKSRLRRIAATPYPYLIFYRVGDDAVVIHGVRHSARDPASMPK